MLLHIAFLWDESFLHAAGHGDTCTWGQVNITCTFIIILAIMVPFVYSAWSLFDTLHFEDSVFVISSWNKYMINCYNLIVRKYSYFILYLTYVILYFYYTISRFKESISIKSSVKIDKQIKEIKANK